jgi:hypothetical protein
MNKELINAWQKLKPNDKLAIFNEVANKTGLPTTAIEKDWWVVRTLDLVFQTEIAPHTVFKGGTSLSKAWKLIDRFSEDIDMALDRKFLGFDGEMTKSQVAKLRKHSFKYISESYLHILQKTFKDTNFPDVELQIRATTSNDQDPLIIEVNYPSYTEKSEYIQPRVLIEIGGRSLIEPYTERPFCSLVGEHFEGKTICRCSNHHTNCKS